MSKKRLINNIVATVLTGGLDFDDIWGIGKELHNEQMMNICVLCALGVDLESAYSPAIRMARMHGPTPRLSNT